jgi:GTP-binding protein EngB required for normal cell division
MTLGQRVRGALRSGSDRVDADALVVRAEAVHRFVRAAGGVVAEDRLAPARALVERTGERLALSREHTVVALAGATGSGKSSLFNALSGLDLSDVGVRRPTTGEAHACVWGVAGASPLLDWLGIPGDLRFVRESPLDGDDELALRGLVLLDLPDFDSVQTAHRLEVERLLALVDLVIWVTDPQKYADQVIHDRYLRTFHQHRDITVVVLNQADRLSPTDVERCVADLRRLLAADGLAAVPAFPVSATDPRPGVDELRGALEKATAARQAALRRLTGDLDELTNAVTELIGPEVAQDAVDGGTAQDLADTLSDAAGVPAVVLAAGQAYRHRAGRALGWPLARLWRRNRQDPLARLHLDRPGEASSLPEPAHAQRAAVGLAVRTVADTAGRPLPEPWAAALRAAARSRLDDLPDALDRAVVGTDLGLTRRPPWWRLVGALQWLVTLAALAGLLWLGVRALLAFLGVAWLLDPHVGRVPAATLLFIGGLLAGVLLSLLVTPLVRAGARRAGRRVRRRLRAAVTEVAREYVITPVHAVLARYAEAREALNAARR